LSAERWDVLVVGGGMVGLAFACRLARTGATQPLRIAVLDREAPLQPGTDLDLRVSAIAPDSRALLDDCDAWHRMPAERLSLYTRMQVWRDLRAGDAERICFDAAEQGLPGLGHIVENNQLRYALWQAAADAGVSLLVGSSPTTLSLSVDSATVELEDGTSHEASLVVGADGSSSWVRGAAQIEYRRNPYRQQGLVMHVRTGRDHARTAWQRFLPDGPLALLPLADGRCSVVWSCPDARAKELLSLDAGRLGSELTRASQEVLGEIVVTTAVRGFPLVAAYARSYARERCVLLGDAAHQVHPLAGQGVNLGFRDAGILADELRAHLAGRRADPGDRRPLLRYQRRRKGDNLATMATMDLINRVFSHGEGPVAGLAARGLGLVERVGPLKRALAGYALGEAGSPPSG